MAKSLDVRVSIQENGETFRVSVRNGGKHTSPYEGGVDLHLHNNMLTTHPLAHWLEQIGAWNLDFLNIWLTKRNQLLLGQRLFEPMQRQLPPAPAADPDEEVHLWIESRSLQPMQFPWHLLANEINFLHEIGWSSSLTTARTPVPLVHLPEAPRVLLLLPQPAGRETRATEHLERLENRLMAADYQFSREHNLRPVGSWAACQELLTTWQPHLIYYHGPGAARDPNDGQPTLLFSEGKRHTPHPVPLAEWEKILGRLAPEEQPQLFYLNGFQGDPEAAVAWGHGASQHLPAVVVGRSGLQAPPALREQVAQHHGFHFLEALLLHTNQPPHKIIANLPHPPGEGHPAIRQGGWNRPILFRHYQQWQNSPPKPGSLIEDPHWFLKLDRRIQYGPVAEESRQMLQKTRPRSLVYLWYGQEKQGVELLHRRIGVQLGHDMKDIILLEKRPRWPDHLDPQDEEGAADRWRETILEAFQVDHMEDIPASIRRESGGGGGRKVLLYMRHEPLRPDSVVQLPALSLYLRWWDRQMTPQLKTGAANAHGLLGLSFIARNPQKFKTLLLQHKLFETILEHTILHILDELGVLGITDLIQFLQANNIFVPSEERITVLNTILQDTGGLYEPTLARLKKLAEQTWDETARGIKTQESSVIPLNDTDY
ncbi:MAG: hypothetical protein H7837_14360 [Magnetococcus sp. MYC-9]